MPRIADWIVVSDSGAVVTCARCGTSHRIDLPMQVRLYLKLLDAFAEVHQECQPKEPNETSRDSST